MELQLDNGNWVDRRYGSRQYSRFFFSTCRERMMDRYGEEYDLLSEALGEKLSERSDCDEPDIWVRATTSNGEEGFTLWVAADILERFRAVQDANFNAQQHGHPQPISTVEEQLESNTVFHDHYYLNLRTSHLHHTQQKAVDRVHCEAMDCIEARDYHKLWAAVSKAYDRYSNDDVLDCISEIWNAVSTCLFYLGVDTSHDYNLAER